MSPSIFLVEQVRGKSLWNTQSDWSHSVHQNPKESARIAWASPNPCIRQESSPLWPPAPFLDEDVGTTLIRPMDRAIQFPP